MHARRLQHCSRGGGGRLKLSILGGGRTTGSHISANVILAFVVGHHERMTRSESFLLKVQGGELDVDRLSETEMASVILALRGRTPRKDDEE